VQSRDFEFFCPKEQNEEKSRLEVVKFERA
jgi:hypothetical protein